MTRYVALLRGINVGSGRKVAMADLRRWLEELELSDVQTYIQSGNALFDDGKRTSRPSRRAIAELRASIEQRLRERAGFAIPTVLRTREQMLAVVASLPFAHAEIGGTHVLFLVEPLDKARFNAIDLDAFAPERVVSKGEELYLSLPNGMGRAKLPVAIGRAGVVGTARNWATVTTLAEMAAR